MIIGITGPVCAGKDSASLFFQQHCGAHVLSFPTILRSRMTALGLTDLSRSATTAFFRDFEEREGPLALTELALAEGARHTLAVLQGLQFPHEFAHVHGIGIPILYLDAPLCQRFARDQARGRHDACTSLGRFIAQELEPPRNAVPGYRLLCDRVVVNSGTQELLFASLRTWAQELNLPFI